ncbi:MerR family transcriptional regulator [Streptomyces sp. NPDC006284]|uniref:MerR family transcriptional regulator n=1 Tax=Streptomyces sp. NPDC006284 TaxID=3156742 RepID=UPI0033AC0F28
MPGRWSHAILRPPSAGSHRRPARSYPPWLYRPRALPRQAELDLGEDLRRGGAVRKGLLEAERGADGYREYEEKTVLRVKQIRHLLGAGLSSGDIEYVLPRRLDRAREDAVARADDLSRQTVVPQPEAPRSCGRARRARSWGPPGERQPMCRGSCHQRAGSPGTRAAHSWHPWPDPESAVSRPRTPPSQSRPRRMVIIDRPV